MKRKTYGYRLVEDFKKNKAIYFMMIPVVLFYIFFHYKPMYGVLMAFFDYKPARGFEGSDFVGLQHFVDFFTSPFFLRTVVNTLAISLGFLVFSFPVPIILALLLNEVKNSKVKRLVQTATYLPHFISLVIICGMLTSFSLTNGLFNDIVVFFGGERSPLLSNPEAYRPIYIISGIWREMGWNSIIYLAALSGVDPQLYEAARLDGASKFHQAIHVTLPSILPTIVIKLILQIGSLMSVGYEKALLLYNPAIYDVADMISTYVFRMGLENYQYGYATAVDLFNSIINVILVITANKISKKLTDSSMW